MEKTNTLTARKGITLATALILVLAMFASLFVVTLGKAAEEQDPNKYTVTFDANGGYFDEVDDKGNNKTTIARTGYKGQGLDDKSPLVPHYPADSYGIEGKFFEGWTATNDTKINVDEATYDPEKDITVKAVWSDKIAVSFDDQQGNKDSVTTYYFDKDNAQIDVREIPQPDPVDGKVFAGWYTDKECTTEALDYGVITPNRTVTYYAGYSDGVKIVLNANGGHYRIAKGTNEDGSINYEFSTTKTVYLQKGDEFWEAAPCVWYDDKVPGGYYTDNEEYKEEVEYGSIITKDLTLYEKWVDAEELTDYYFLEYKVYNNEAKRWETFGPLYQIPVGDSLVKYYYENPGDTATAKFQGWYTDMGLKNPAPAFDGSYTPTDDITLYAKYSDIISVDITYYYANNNGEAVLIDTQAATYVKDDAKSDFSNDTLHRLLTDEELSNLYLNGKDGAKIDPTKNGISTIWYADKAHTKVVNSRNDLTIDKDNKTNMYGVLVKRTPVTLYTPAAIGGDITHMSDVISTPLPEGSKEKYITAEAYINNDMKLGDAAKLYSVKNIPAKARMGFEGWTKTENGTTPVSDETVKNTTKLYAIMNPAYVVTLDLNGGYDREADDTYGARKNVVTVNIPNGQKLGDPIEEGYVYPVYYGDKYLKGWATDRAGENMVEPKELVITENTTLYAQWDRYTDETTPVEPDEPTPVEPDEPTPEEPDEPTPVEPDTKFTGLANEVAEDGNWYYYTDGKIDPTHTGVDQNKNGWWRVENGKVNFKAQGIYQNKYGWWKTTDGEVTFKENSIYQNEYGWWKCKDSKVDFSAQSIYQNKYGWWKTTNGKVTFKETGIFKNQYGNWYCKDSKVDFKKKGKVTYNKHVYNVTNGKAVLVK